MAEPYRQLPAEKRRRILDAALEEFAKKDYKSASTDDIAARSAEWFQGGGQAHDARFDTAATYMCLLEATKKGDVRGVL